MDPKDLLKEGGWVITVICTAVYICGWQYYLGLFHSMKISMHFFIPITKGIGYGVEPVITVLALPCLLAATTGWLGAFPFVKYWPLLFAVAVIVGALLPVLIRCVSARWLAIVLRWWEILLLSLLGSGISATIFILIQNSGLRSSFYRWYYYALATILFITTSAYYAAIRGRNAGSRENDRKVALLNFSDEKMQDSFGKHLFSPVLELGDEAIFVYFNEQHHPINGKKWKIKDGRIVFIKKSLIRAVEYIDYPGPTRKP